MSPSNTASDVHVDAPLGKKKRARKRRQGPGGESPDSGVAVVDAEDEDEEELQKSQPSLEYLAAFHAHAKEHLQPWQHRHLHRMALPSSGGAAGRRQPEHSAIEQAILGKLSPKHVKDMGDEELAAAWGDLERWHQLATKKNLDTDNYEKAAAVIADELERRGTVQVDPESALARSIVAKSSYDAVAATAVNLVAGDGMLSKADAPKGIVWYAVAVPGELDTSGHRILPETAEDACHRYMKSPRLVGMEHGMQVGLNAAGKWPEILNGGAAVCVECGLTMAPTDKAFGQPLPRVLPERTWYIANQYLDSTLRDQMLASPHGASWRGKARRVNRTTGEPIR